MMLFYRSFVWLRSLFWLNKLLVGVKKLLNKFGSFLMGCFEVKL